MNATEEARQADLARSIVKAWDALPGGYHPHKAVEEWLSASMWPVIQQARTALAARRTDSAERMPGEVRALLAAAYDAGFAASGEGWNGEYPGDHVGRDGYEHPKREYLDSIATPAPSSPGVPDSVRALSEAAFPGPWSDEGERIGGAAWHIEPPWNGGDIICDIPSEGEDSRKNWPANAAFIVAAVNFVRTLLSTHPAGQSTGQGAVLTAEDLAPCLCGAEPLELCRREDQTCAHPNHVANRDQPAPDSTRTGPVVEERDKWLDWRGAVEGMEQSIATATRAVEQVRAGCGGEETAEDFAKNICWMLGLDHVWQHVGALRAALADKQAPAVASALRDEAKRLHDKAEALAARPAAPEMGCLGPASAPSTKEGLTR